MYGYHYIMGITQETEEKSMLTKNVLWSNLNGTQKGGRELYMYSGALIHLLSFYSTSESTDDIGIGGHSFVRQSSINCF